MKTQDVVQAFVEALGSEIEKRVRAEVTREVALRALATDAREQANRAENRANDQHTELAHAQAQISRLQERERSLDAHRHDAAMACMAARADLAEAWRWIEYAQQTIDALREDLAFANDFESYVRRATNCPSDVDAMDAIHSIVASNAQRMDRAAADERERCAKICDAATAALDGQGAQGAYYCAAQIRGEVGQ